MQSHCHWLPLQWFPYNHWWIYDWCGQIVLLLDENQVCRHPIREVKIKVFFSPEVDCAFAYNISFFAYNICVCICVFSALDIGQCLPTCWLLFQYRLHWQPKHSCLFCLFVFCLYLFVFVCICLYLFVFVCIFVFLSFWQWHSCGAMGLAWITIMFLFATTPGRWEQITERTDRFKSKSADDTYTLEQHSKWKAGSLFETWTIVSTNQGSSHSPASCHKQRCKKHKN